MEVEKPKVSISQISQETKQKLLRKSAFSLPDNPAARGMKPNEIKKYLYSAIVDFDDKYIEKDPSIVGIIETLINETLQSFTSQQNYLDAVFAYIEERVEKINLDFAEFEERLTQETSNREQAIKQLNTKDTELMQLITALQNAGYITKDVSNLTNYYKKDETYSKAEINELHEVLAGLGIEFSVVQTLPTTGDNKTIYLLPATDVKDQDIYDEYIYIGSKWEKIGSTAVNLADYYNKTEIDNLLKNYAPKHWEGTRQEFEEAQDSIAVGTICIIKEVDGTVSLLDYGKLDEFILA